MQGVGALALDWLKCSLQAALNDSKNYLSKTHPSAGRYKGNNWLTRVATEYQQRFGIDFATAPTSFDRIQELVLARNAGVHRDGGNLKTYLRQITRPIFVDEHDEFYVRRDALIGICKDCQNFVRWIVSEIEKKRPSSKPKASMSSSDCNQRGPIDNVED